MRESSSLRGFHTSSFIMRQGGFDTHLCTHLQRHAISLPGNGPGITVRKRRQGDAQQQGFFAQKSACERGFHQWLIHVWHIHFYKMLHCKWSHQQLSVGDRKVIWRGYGTITQHAHILSTENYRIRDRNFPLTLIKHIHRPLQRLVCTWIQESVWIKGTAGQLWNCNCRRDEKNDSTVWKMARDRGSNWPQSYKVQNVAASSCISAEPFLHFYHFFVLSE